MLPLAFPYSGISCFLCEITSTVPVPSCLNAQKLGAWKRVHKTRDQGPSWDQSAFPAGLFYLDKALEGQCSGPQ